MLPNDKETLLLLYGKGRNEHDISVQSMRGRNLSPSQQILMDSISSRDRMYDSEYIVRDHYASPTHAMTQGQMPVSPEINYEHYRVMSEGRESIGEPKEIHNVQVLNKPRSALSGLKDKRYFSMPKARKRSRQSVSSSRSGIPTYFKDAAELLASRLIKQLRKNFDKLRLYSEGKKSIVS
jgi:hypothetical protein